jgi:phenylacetate-CoA ligase
VELLPIGSASGQYRLVGTNFTNPATPLVRYEVNDHATLAADGCSCGRPGRVLERVDGRREDYVLLADGTRLGRLDHIFKDLTAVREAQIVQQARGAITVRIVRGSDYGLVEERQLLAEARRRLGVDMQIELTYVDRLERSATGKLRFVVNHVDEGKAIA